MEALILKDEDGRFRCPCGHTAPAKWNVKRHMKDSCKVVKAASLNVDKAAVAELKASLEAEKALRMGAVARIEELTEETASLKAKIKELEARPSRTVTNHNIDDLPPIRKFRLNRGVQHVSLDEEMLPSKTLVKELLSDPMTAVPKYFELKYFTGTVTPSIRMTNVKKRELLVVECGQDGTNRWARVDTGDTIEWLVDTSYDELRYHYKAKREPAYKRWTKQERLDEPAYDKTPAFKKMKKDFEEIIIQHSKKP